MCWPLAEELSGIPVATVASLFWNDFLDFYEVEYDDGFQKIIHQSKIREQDTTNKVKIVKEYLNADKLQTVHLQISVCRYS